MVAAFMGYIYVRFEQILEVVSKYKDSKQMQQDFWATLYRRITRTFADIVFIALEHRIQEEIGTLWVEHNRTR